MTSPSQGSSSASLHDVAVIGAGPAGATAARLLAEWGHSVVLLSPRGEGARLAVSVPPSSRKILAEVGALAVVETAGFLRTTGNTAWWGTPLPRVESFGEAGHGWQALRSDLEALLRRAAVRSGVVSRACRVRDVRRDRPGVLVIDAEPEGGPPEAVRARHVLDASGRVGVVARRYRRPQGPRTVALTRVFRSLGGFRVPDDTHTLVEAHAGGWAFSVPLARGERHATVMLDPPPRETRPRDLVALFARELAKASELSVLFHEAEAIGPTVALDSSAYTSLAFAPDGILLVGDAASFLDPLSSFGVKKALFSGWLAAVATHTALVQPDETAMAFSFYASQEHRLHARYARETTRYALEAAADHPSSVFWAARARVEAAEPDAEDTPLASEHEVRAAYERLRAHDGLRLQLHEEATIVSAPAVRGRTIVRSEALLGPDGRVAQFVEGISASVMARLVERSGAVGEICSAYGAVASPAPLGTLLRALSTLVAAGFVREADGRAAR